MPIFIPPEALKELQLLEDEPWSVSAQELVQWVNQTAERYLPSGSEGKSKRVSDNLSLRTMRHYQTLGCIDPPVRDGRDARYGFRHYLQALLVRKMLWQRVPSEKIARLLPSRTTSDYKNLLLEDVEWLVSPVPSRSPSGVGADLETWNRIRVMAGVELHLQEDVASLDDKRITALLERIGVVLRCLCATKNQHKAAKSRS